MRVRLLRAIGLDCAHDFSVCLCAVACVCLCFEASSLNYKGLAPPPARCRPTAMTVRLCWRRWGGRRGRRAWLLCLRPYAVPSRLPSGRCAPLSLPASVSPAAGGERSCCVHLRIVCVSVCLRVRVGRACCAPLQASTGCLWYGRDRVGRRSLLIHQGDSWLGLCSAYIPALPTQGTSPPALL